jgi:Tfp pilus assembly protein PilN
MKLISFLQANMEKGVDLAEFPIIVTGDLVAQAYGETRNPGDDESFVGRISRLTGHAVEVLEFPFSYPLSFSPHAFATNIGLFMRESKKRNSSTGDISHYRDVNIDILNGRFRSRPARVPAWLAAVPVTVFVIAMAGWTVNSAYSDSHVEKDALQMEAQRLNNELIQAKKAESQQADLLKKIESTQHRVLSEKANREALCANQGLYVDNIDKIRTALPGDTYLVAMDMSDTSVRLTGFTDTPYKVVDYVQALETAGYAPRLEEIGAPDLRGFTFRISIGYDD